MRRTALAAAVTAVLAAAGCSAGSPLPSGGPSAAAARTAPGPFRIQPVSCGKFTKAQQNQFGTNAAGGFVYRYTNTSMSFTGSPQVTVNFTKGTAVEGADVTGTSPSVSPGQSAEAEVDALTGGGGNLTFTGCTPTSYLALTPSGTSAGGPYRG